MFYLGFRNVYLWLLMVKLGWVLVPKWLDLNKVFVDNDHIDILVKGD